MANRWAILRLIFGGESYRHLVFRGKKAGNDSRFFSSSKKGENHELREELRSPQRDRKRDAVKKVCWWCVLLHYGGFWTLLGLIIGYCEHDDRKGCFHAIYWCYQLHPNWYAFFGLYFLVHSEDFVPSDNLELKKLVYLYLINYAKSQPDLALLAVNTFVKDANDPVRNISIWYLSSSWLEDRYPVISCVISLESFDSCTCHSNHGLHSCWENHGISVRTPK